MATAILAKHYQPVSIASSPIMELIAKAQTTPPLGGIVITRVVKTAQTDINKAQQIICEVRASGQVPLANLCEFALQSAVELGVIQ